MSRPLRPDLVDGWFHVMNRGISHGDVFFDDRDRVEMGQRFADIYERFGVVTHAYCLMDNHYHALVHCPHGHLSEAMQRLGSLYTRHVNDRLGRDGALFRGRFASRQILDDGYLLTACRYIHRNPLALEGVRDVADYRWSSHRTYLGLRRTPPWMRTDEVLSHWDGDRSAFDRFVGADEPSDTVELSVGRLRAMIAACAFVLDEVERDGSGARLARLLALDWAVSNGADRATVMEAFGISTRGALHSATHRARARVAGNAALGAVVERAAGLIATAGRSRLGSDPWRDQRAARAAS